MSATAPMFLAETGPATAVPFSRADRSPETMQRLRQPFQAQPEPDLDAAEPAPAR